MQARLRVNPACIAPALSPVAAWRFPTYARALLRQTHRIEFARPGAPLLLADAAATTGLQHCDPLSLPLASLAPWLAATFVEWRYFSIIAPAFHGIVGMALFNPFNHCEQIAEGGLLCIVAGVLGAPRQSARLAEVVASGHLQRLCWMHIFPTDCLSFGGPDLEEASAAPEQTGATLQAAYGGVRLAVEQQTPQHTRIDLTSETGLTVALTHTGLEGTALAPVFAEDLGRTPAAHWIVANPSPIARTTGTIHLAPAFLASSQQPATVPAIVSPALAAAAGAEGFSARWEDANGYYEHSFGLNPLLLHGWDFLFVPDAAQRQGLVLQTYRRSRALRYLEVFWQQGGEQCYTRFTADELRLVWEDVGRDPAIGVRLPGRRIIEARKPGLRLEVENTIPYQVPLLRTERMLVRHFFISEQIGFCSWRLTDDAGHTLAEAHEQPAGGEVAHARLQARRQVGHT